MGKTTLIMRIYESLKLSYPNLKLQGFYSEEIRQGNERFGFEVVSLDGRRARLACTTSPSPSPSPRFFLFLTLFLKFSFRSLKSVLYYGQSGSLSVALCWEIQGGCSIVWIIGIAWIEGMLLSISFLYTYKYLVGNLVI